MTSCFWRDRSVFVTGGTGLLGTWIVLLPRTSPPKMACGRVCAPSVEITWIGTYPTAGLAFGDENVTPRTWDVRTVPTEISSKFPVRRGLPAASRNDSSSE